MDYQSIMEAMSSCLQKFWPCEGSTILILAQAYEGYVLQNVPILCFKNTLWSHMEYKEVWYKCFNNLITHFAPLRKGFVEVTQDSFILAWFPNIKREHLLRAKRRKIYEVKFGFLSGISPSFLYSVTFFINYFHPFFYYLFIIF